MRLGSFPGTTTSSSPFVAGLGGLRLGLARFRDCYHFSTLDHGLGTTSWGEKPWEGSVSLTTSLIY